MGADFECKEYQESKYRWDLVSDLYEGEDVIKKAGRKYIPALGGQENAEYISYVNRGSFFNAYSRTIQGLVGFIFRKPMEIDVNDKVKELLPTIMSTGQSFKELCKAVTLLVMKKGRVGLLVDSYADKTPYIALYEPESIINWKVEFVDGEEQLTLLVLRENADKQSNDEFSDEKQVQYRIFRLEGDVVSVEVAVRTDKGFLSEPRIYPKIKGKSLKKIMFNIIGSEENTMKVNKPPFLDLAFVNLAHWRLSVDYAHGLHFCALPTPWAAGFDLDADLSVGPVKAWISNNIGASCGYMEFTGQGLGAIKDAKKSLEDNMAILGSRVIEQNRSRVETAEAARIRQSGESGALTAIVENISEGLTVTIKRYTEWVGNADDSTYVKMNTDFIDTSVSPQEITALLAALQSGSMSLDTFLYNLKMGEILPPGREVEDEKLLIEAEGVKSFNGSVPFSNNPKKINSGGNNPLGNNLPMNGMGKGNKSGAIIEDSEED